ncbi:MAG: acyltransferase domain-containing protein [Acidimicrobiales bacterium]
MSSGSGSPRGAADVAGPLGFGRWATGWAHELETVGKPPYEVVLPSADEATEILGRLGVGGLDAADVVATLPSRRGTPEWWWLLERACHSLTRAMGDPDWPHSVWPSWVGQRFSLQRRCFMAHVFLATMRHTLAWHRRLGIPEAISRASMSDLARHMTLHRRIHETTGVDAPWWLSLCLRAELFELGRLQFNWFHLGVGDQSPAWYPAEEARRRGAGFRHGEVCCGVHIPESGPLTPAACDESFERAKNFFAEYFPLSGQSRRLATCWSWLMDDQLATWLPADSNIMRFQRRFELVPGWVTTDDSMLEFVFRVPDGLERLDALPQRTTLQRAAVAHLRAGGHWHSRSGWVDL